jgi:hypothetical protein
MLETINNMSFEIILNNFLMKYIRISQKNTNE